MYLSEKEREIIRVFMTNLDMYIKEEMKLVWKDGSMVVARFDTCFDDDNDLEMDDPKYEEYVSFVFEVISVMGNPPVYITEDEYFCVSYHNFPDEIIADNKKIN